MLTRAQVAERLKKSIATVRRYENRVLFPIIGRNDVRYFDEDAVEELRENPELAWEWGRSEWFDDNVATAPARTAPPRVGTYRADEQRTPVVERHAVPVASPSSFALVDDSWRHEQLEAVELLEQLLCSVLDAPVRDLTRIGIDDAWLDAVVEVLKVLKADARTR